MQNGVAERPKVLRLGDDWRRARWCQAGGNGEEAEGGQASLSGVR